MTVYNKTGAFTLTSIPGIDKKNINVLSADGNYGAVRIMNATLHSGGNFKCTVSSGYYENYKNTKIRSFTSINAYHYATSNSCKLISINCFALIFIISLVYNFVKIKF